MVINKCGERLYKGVVDTVTAHLTGVAARVEEAAGGEALLRDLTARWEDHNKSMQMIRDILMVPPPPAPLHRLYAIACACTCHRASTAAHGQIQVPTI